VAHEFDTVPKVPTWFTALPRPVAFYAGALEHRVDVDGLLAAARALPGWSFCLVGPMRNQEQFAPLAAEPNVHIHTPVRQPQVLAMATAADVCLIPHRRTEMSVSMSPLKLYEYLAAGAPVVATDLPPIRGVSDRVVLVEPGGDYATAVATAARMAPVDLAELQAWRTQNDWARRYATFMDIALSRSVPRSARSSGKALGI
jgi:teichuronic acid biosynthesis glycosyltransferase TuaH